MGDPGPSPGKVVDRRVDPRAVGLVELPAERVIAEGERLGRGRGRGQLPEQVVGGGDVELGARPVL